MNRLLKLDFISRDKFRPDRIRMSVNLDDWILCTIFFFFCGYKSDFFLCLFAFIYVDWGENRRKMSNWWCFIYLLFIMFNKCFVAGFYSYVDFQFAMVICRNDRKICYEYKKYIFAASWFRFIAKSIWIVFALLFIN